MTTSISNLHFDILDKKRQELLIHIQPLIKGFVLGGGTALALQLNHRRSFDFDFFSDKEIGSSLLESLSQHISLSSVQVDLRSELTVYTASEVKLTFLYYPFKRSFEETFSSGGITLFPVQMIAVQKAYTIGRRGEYRDYFDLYCILKKGGISLEEIIERAREVYGSIFSEKLFLQQLVYFEDILDFTIIPSPNTSVATPDEVKVFFEDLVVQYVG